MSRGQEVTMTHTTQGSCAHQPPQSGMESLGNGHTPERQIELTWSTYCTLAFCPQTRLDRRRRVRQECQQRLGKDR